MPVDSQARHRYLDDVSGVGGHRFQERRTAIQTTAGIPVAARNGKSGERSNGTELDELGIRVLGDEV
jgi:hypothetical protein